ncbi:MAG: cryptochrome/photolyase family protein [Pseudomonadales bacterium]|jgi:deoxyribodipyrimidine photolyase-related protein
MTTNEAALGDGPDAVLIVFGNQLFHPRHLPAPREVRVLLVEDQAMCTRYAWHQQKLALVLGAMRDYQSTLTRSGYLVTYHALDEGLDWQRALERLIALGVRRMVHFEVESPALAKALTAFALRHECGLKALRSPMFLGTRADFDAHLAEQGVPRMANFYRAQRERTGILMGATGTPVGGRFSFDPDNRERLPRELVPPAPMEIEPTAAASAVRRLVADRFSEHPGSLDSAWVPTSHAQAESWLDDFLVNRFHHFGTYEDALTERSPFVYHSALAPLLNIGLLTPDRVLDRALEFGARESVPLNSLEGFVRQILGWREFVRGVFHHYYDPMQSRNIWRAERKLTPAWYTGDTGIAPLDHVIHKTLRFGWAHHIERLMVAANLMNLAGIQPQEVYRWFMEMFVDAYDWVMVPNVFGMGLTSDGGIFTTKPYICGSNYLRKMGDYAPGPWCDVMDGLLWRFVANHETTLRANNRLAPMVANLARVARKRPEIFALAEDFIETHTRAA